MPPLSWNEIKSRAVAFSRRWADEASEQAEAKTFWNEFFHVFGIDRRRVASFEQRVKKLDGRDGCIDLLWKGKLLIEHKSRGKDLDRAHQQALGYFPGLKERELPRCILVSDFARFRLYDLEEDSRHDFELKELHKHLRLFGFIAGYQSHAVREQDPVNIKAAERMGRLHDLMQETGYGGHALEVYLVRLLFCLFAEDTGIFQPQQFQDYIEQRTGEDGSDTGPQLAAFFQVLNTPEDRRFKHLDEQLAAFPFINGKLFEEPLPIAAFDAAMRQSLLDCCGLDWSRISPAIFGSLFQSIMDKQARRNLGAHYTSEQNILKLIRPLFLDSLREDFVKVKGNRRKLEELHKKLRGLTFLDPACGCGNFPWPENPSAKQRQAVEAAAQAVLDARAQFPAASLADLYDPLTMPPVLLKAHQTLDRAADAAYGKSGFKSEAERVAFLFDLHQKYTASLLPLAAKEKKPGRRKKTAAGQGH